MQTIFSEVYELRPLLYFPKLINFNLQKRALEYEHQINNWGETRKKAYIGCNSVV